MINLSQISSQVTAGLAALAISLFAISATVSPVDFAAQAPVASEMRA